tara:strand:- start:4146 stop:5132 length:987 start_codon:yes stop_codon:yes gene_type:complete
MINILVCGATGFIGRNLVNILALNKNYQIHAVSHINPCFDVPDAFNKVIWHNSDLLNSGSVAKLLVNKDIIIQAAATTSGSKDIVNTPYLHVTDNAIMNSLLLRQAMESKVSHFIFFSCTVMYQSSSIPLKEKDWDPSDEIYHKYFGVANTKIYIEQMLDFYSRISPMKTTAIRHSNIYGPHDKFDFERSHVCGATISKALTAQKDMVVWGSGEEERDLLYVDDLVDFVEKVILNQSKKFQIYNCGSGDKISINELVRKIIKTSKKNLNIKHDLSKPTIKTNLQLDCGLAELELGWKVKTSLEEGINKTISWWEDNIDPSTLKVKKHL